MGGMRQKGSENSYPSIMQQIEVRRLAIEAKT